MVFFLIRDGFYWSGILVDILVTETVFRLRCGRFLIILNFISHQSAAVCRQFRQVLYAHDMQDSRLENHQKTFGRGKGTGGEGRERKEKGEWPG